MSARTIPFIAANLFAAGWAWFLVGKHYQAEADALEPGLLCGDGSCGAVLASAWSTVGGVPVSAPAVPMFAALALCGALILAGKADPRRVASAGTGAGILGLLFGGFLLWIMLGEVGEICRYCLVMDAATLAVLGASLALHPDGAGAALRGLGAALKPRAGPELLVAATVALGTPLLHAATFEEPPPPPVVEVVEEDDEPEAVVAAEDEDEPEAEPKPTRRLVLPKTAIEIALNPTIPIRGKQDAPVTLVLFEDFQCPYCSQLAGNVEGLLDQRPDDVRVAFVHFPMHQSCNEAELAKSLHHRACAASFASVCAQAQGEFWGMHDILFLHSQHLADEDLRDYASTLGLDLPAFDACMLAPETREKVLADTRIAKEIGVRGTPTYFMNGRRLAGAHPTEVLVAAVDLVKKGTAETVSMDVELAGEISGAVQSAAEVTIGAFTIDAFEARIVDGVAQTSPGVEPARAVSWYEADAACKAADKRLCTEQEWLTACTGELAVDTNHNNIYSDDRIRGRQQPYGSFKQMGWCLEGRNPDDPGEITTGTHPRCATPDGIYDMVGGVKEWVGLTPPAAGTKGGSYLSATSGRCGYFKDSISPDAKDETIGFRCCSGEPPEALADTFPGGKVGDAVQPWSGLRLDGGLIGAKELRDRPYLITFWATWCAPCRKELAALTELYPALAAKGLEIVAVSIDKDLGKLKRHLANQPLPFPVVVDPQQELMNGFDTRGTPTTFWITSSGRIRQRTIGYDGRPEHLQTDLEALLEAVD